MSLLLALTSASPVASAENPASLPHLGLGATSVAEASSGNAAPFPHLSTLFDVSANRTLTADFGTYSVTGYDAKAFYSMVAAQGTYTVAGQAAGALYSLFAQQGTYSLSGQDAGLFRSYTLPSDQGSYSVTGYAAGAAYSLFGEAGYYSITGNDASLLKSGDPVPEPTPEGNNNHPGRWKYVYNKNQFVRRVGKDLVVYEYIEPDEPQTEEEKKVTVIKKGKPAIPVAAVPVAQIKRDAKQYPSHQQRIMRMFEQAQFEQILIAYERMQQEEDEDMEMVLYTL